MKVLILIVCFCLLVLGSSHAIQAQPQIANSPAPVSGGSRQPARLNGQVRRVRVETVNLLIKEGKTVEGPRVVRQITTYDLRGQEIDSVAYPAEDSTVAGNKHYLYDAKGNIIEMVLRGDDGSILSKEKYDYQFDEFGNWKKMTASIAVYENGSIGYEPSAITYRTITYYYGQPAPKVNTPPTATPISNASTTATAGDQGKIIKPASNEPSSVAATETATGDLTKTNKAAEAVVIKPEKSEESITAPAAVKPKDDAAKLIAGPTVTPVSYTSTTATAGDRAKITASNEPATSEVTKTSNAAEAIVAKPEKSEPSITAPAAVTPRDEAPGLPVIRMSEEALRKAAIDLPQPLYPEAAMLTGAHGSVEVQILVDEKGGVMNASAVSGNPLFSEVAVAAARKAKFSRTKLSPDPARIYGVINYTFTLPRDEPVPSVAATGASGEPRKSQPSQRTSDLKTLQPGDSSQPNSKPGSLPPAASFYAKGSTFMTSGNYSAAVEAFRQATERDPNDAAAYAKLGIAYAALQQNQEAVAVLKMAIRIKPEVVDAEAYYQLSNAYSALGKFPQALEAIKQAMYIKRAEQANPAEAGANTSEFPSLAELHYTTGLAYYNERRYSEAIEEMKRVIAMNPKQMQAYYGLALAYLAVGDRKSAEKQQQALESLDPAYAAKVAKMLSSLRSDPGMVSPRKSLVF